MVRISDAARRLGFSMTITTMMIGVTACAWSQNERYQVRLEKTGAPARHAVHGKRLRALMGDLKALLFERQLTQIEIDEDRRRYLVRTVEVSNGLLESATHIAESADDLREDERASFLALQNKLVSQTRALRVLAESGRSQAIAPQFQAITTTCNACHSNFRDASRSTP